MNKKQWHRRITTCRTQTERETETSFLPQNIGRITVRFHTDPPILLRVQIGIREVFRDRATNLTEVEQPAAYPDTG